MNLFQIFLFVALSFVESNGFPQSASEIAIGTKHTEQLYYNMDAPDLIPYNNSPDIDNAKEEVEGYGSKIDSVYDGVQKKVSGVFNRQPIVDDLKEAEKYGNNGDQLKGLIKFTTSSLSVVSNLANAALDAPGNAIQAILMSSNNVLNGIGAKIVGLQK